MVNLTFETLPVKCGRFVLAKKEEIKAQNAFQQKCVKVMSKFVMTCLIKQIHIILCYYSSFVCMVSKND